jgi:hypothetical protein
MSQINKTKFRSARSKRRKMAEPDESKVRREQELSAGPSEESAATSGPAFEEPPAPKNKSSLSRRDNHETGAKTMDEKENTSRELFEGFSDMTSTLFSAKSARKIAELWIEKHREGRGRSTEVPGQSDRVVEEYDVRADLRDAELDRPQVG